MPAIPAADDLKALVADALCPGDMGFNDQGYLSPCFANTYLFSPIAAALTIWALSDIRSLATDDHRANSTSQRIKFLLTVLYVFAVVRYGPLVFNVISHSTSMITMLVVFVLSFLDLKGVSVPQKQLEVYFFLAAAVTGYLTVQRISLRLYDETLKGTIILCTISSIAGSARNIISAFDDAQSEALKKTKAE